MWNVVIAGLPGLDGEYPLEPPFKMKDYRTIKRISGVRSLEVEDAISSGDADFLLALVVIALQRANKPFREESLWDAEPGAIKLVDADAEDDARPPELVTPNEPTESPPTSGPPSSDGGAHFRAMASRALTGTPA